MKMAVVERRCYICGAVGFEELIATCMNCKSTFIHLYCMKTVQYVIPYDWLCEDCSETPEQGVYRKKDLPTPLELHIKMHTQSKDGQFVDQRSADIGMRSREILSQRTTQFGTLPSFQDECEVFLEAAGGMGLGGAVFGLGSAASNYYSPQVRAPRRNQARVGELQQETISLRAAVVSLGAAVADFQTRAKRFRAKWESKLTVLEAQMKAFMDHMSRFQLLASTSRSPPPSSSSVGSRSPPSS